MKLERLALRGIGPFRDAIELDLSAIEGRLVAVVGPNGAGKSTLLEAGFPGVMYRTTPTRGSLADLATARDAFVEATVVNGQRWRIRHSVDGVSGKSESLVLGEDGQPAVESGKVRDYDAWAAKHLPPPEVLFASSFAAQGSGGFLDLKAGERKAVLLRVLGCERYELLAQRARERAAARKAELSTQLARIQDERRRGLDVNLAEAAVESAHADAAKSTGELQTARQRLAAAEAALQEQKAAVEVLRRANALRDHATRIASERQQTQGRIENNRRLLADEETIRATAAKHAEFGKEFERLKAEEIAASREAAGKAEDVRDANQRLARARDQLCEVAARGKRLSVREAEAKQAAEDAGELPFREEALKAAEADHAKMSADVERIQAETLDGAGRRIAGLRTGLREIGNNRDPKADLGGMALDTIAEDDYTARCAEEAPAQLRAAKKVLADAQAEMTEARAALSRARLAAARAVHIDAIQSELRATGTEITSLNDQIGTEEDALQNAAAVAVDCRRIHTEAMQHMRAVEADLSRLAPVLAKVPHLDAARARIEELEAAVRKADEEAARVQAELAALPPPPPPAPPVDITGTRRAVEAAEEASRHAHGMIAVAEGRLDEAKTGAAHLQSLEGRRGEIEEDLADWNLLAESLGRGGLQALEIDAAGPELTELINDLLHTCVSTRWTVTVETTRLSADGKKEIEGCEVRIIDTERGREGEAESLSGGERVLVGEAISLALSMLATRRAGLQGVTLVRDETSAALDPAKAKAYVAMLRRAADIVGASKVLYVSHTPAVQELADARIEIADGKVLVSQ
jgi:exonuclease SbcC